MKKKHHYEKSEKNETDNRSAMYSALAMFTQVGLVMFSTIAVSLLIGYFLDNWLDTTPLFIITMSVLGIVASIRNMYYTLTRDFRKPKDKVKNEEE
ncbi:MAG: AtpZ/AtpI family protein [Defluviitaleaceae bacterium]|nr:AtpZ/AtpI family protein [Defluviitaleaceae bacterium]